MATQDENTLRRPVEGARLKRTLGLYGVVAVAVGGMVGSGIFVLPSLAYDIAGPALVLAYFLAGLVVLPAALSKSEMATAMPEAGGTYLYIDRAMGPLMGTLAGFGVWVSLVFKSAFALVGLGLYLNFFADLPTKPIAVGIAVLLIGLNIAGVRETARFQSVLITGVIAVLVVFVLVGIGEVDSENFEPFAPFGLSGVLAATGVVFVTYAGVTKVASVAEEVQRPRRNLPLGMLGSTFFMMLLYPALAAVMVGTLSAVQLTSTRTPMADSAEAFAGDVAATVIAVTAVVALVGMANAGLLSSARYPFAMARNALAPRSLAAIWERSGTPIVAIALTGGLMVALILFVPLLELAKLASAFQLLVFGLVNLALIAFRESRLDWYRPTFRSPFYPWVQIFGIAATILLVAQMGLIPLIGAILIIAAGFLWYRAFGRSRASRESAALEAVRARANDRLVAMTEGALNSAGRKHVLVPVQRPIRPARERDLIKLALYMAQSPGGRVQVLQFDPTPMGTELQIDEDRAIARQLGVQLDIEVIDTPERRRTIYQVANEGADLLIAELPQELRATRQVVRDLRWLREHLPIDSVFVRNRHITQIDTIAIMGTGGPYDPVKIDLASRIAGYEGAVLRLVHVVQQSATADQMASIETYHTSLAELLAVPAESRVEPAEDLVDTLTRLSRGANLVVLGVPTHRFHIFTELADRIAETLDCPALLVHIPEPERRSWTDSVIERLLS